MAKGKYQEWLEDYNLILLEGWARDGLTDEQIAYNIGINVKTLFDWKNKYNPICEALKKVRLWLISWLKMRCLNPPAGMTLKSGKRSCAVTEPKKKYTKSDIFRQVIPLRYSGLKTGGQTSGETSRPKLLQTIWKSISSSLKQSRGWT